MFRILITLFILVPIVEIAVFIQVGDRIGLSATILVVIVTAVIGVNLLKQQGFKSWQAIQSSMAQGRVPAIEMASAAQLLFAGGLLLTPGFVTDLIGFLLMVPQIRLLLASSFIKQTTVKTNPFNPGASSGQSSEQSGDSQKGRTIEGEFESKD